MSLTRQVVPRRLLVALLFCAGASSAEPAAESPSCEPSKGSLAFLGCSLAQKLGPTAFGASVSVVELKSDRELPPANAPALRERSRDAVANALRVGSAGRTRERSKLVVELSLDNNAGMLRVSADLRRTTGLWERVRHVKSHVEQHAFVEVPLDAELRALIPPPALIVSETLKVKAPEPGIIAIACGPLGSDGGQELALVSRNNVRVGRIAGRSFVERKRAAWSALSPIAPSPLREPIASAEITREGTLRLGISDRKEGLELSRDLAVTARFDALLPMPGGGCAARSGLGFLARFDSCQNPAGVGRTQPTTLDAVAGVPGAQLGRDLASGKLSGARPELGQVAHRVGAQLAMGDADSDGNPELAYSADTLDAAKDRLTVVTLKGNKLTPRFELAAPSIAAVAICSKQEGLGMAPIVVASGDELWLLR